MKEWSLYVATVKRNIEEMEQYSEYGCICAEKQKRILRNIEELRKEIIELKRMVS